MGKSNQGKRVEEKIRKLLKSFTEQWAWFDFERLPDARTGYYVKRPADFAFYLPGYHGLVEVKSVQHDYRVPRKNITQLEKMYRRQLAGGIVIVVVEHSTTGMWRMPDFGWLYERKTDPSWDLRQFDLLTFKQLKQALEDSFTHAFTNHKRLTLWRVAQNRDNDTIGEGA